MDEMEPSASVEVKVTETTCPVFAGFGERLFTVTVGALSLAVSDPWAAPVEPLLSVAVTVIVKVWLGALPVEAYVWTSVVAVPGKLSIAVPSPQFTVTPETVPSVSVEVNLMVTVTPVLAGFGAMLVMVTTGG